MSGKKPPRAVQRLKQLCVTLDRETTAEIDAVAKSEGLTRSQTEKYGPSRDFSQ